MPPHYGGMNIPQTPYSAPFVKARDGRPFDVASGHWQLDGQIAAALIARAKALGQDIQIDYDH